MNFAQDGDNTCGFEGPQHSLLHFYAFKSPGAMSTMLKETMLLLIRDLALAVSRMRECFGQCK